MPPFRPGSVPTKCVPVPVSVMSMAAPPEVSAVIRAALVPGARVLLAEHLKTRARSAVPGSAEAPSTASSARVAGGEAGDDGRLGIPAVRQLRCPQPRPAAHHRAVMVGARHFAGRIYQVFPMRGMPPPPMHGWKAESICNRFRLVANAPLTV